MKLVTIDRRQKFLVVLLAVTVGIDASAGRPGSDAAPSPLGRNPLPQNVTSEVSVAT